MPGSDRLSGGSSGPTVIALKCGRRLQFSRSPLIMGILNATPDSFFPGSRAGGAAEGAARALAMVAVGADILDVGGESSRPGAEYVSAETEIARIVPLIEAIRRESEIPISVDTRKAEVARRAVRAGADIVNDISAMRDDPDMAGTIVELQVPIVLMHMQGTPLTMQKNPRYVDVVSEVADELQRLAAGALRAGVPHDAIILDPGIGFGKRVSDNLALLRGIPQLKRLGYPVLIGLSRKGFLGSVTGGKAVEERLAATIAANAFAALAGADILRVHDVAETSDLRRVLEAISAED
ncbi:MAG TPA: dihydropteroate synthase [Spirochaetia bacterium]|nr:dihydropteroate synthase [Spirochaetia bacterium]